MNFRYPVFLLAVAATCVSAAHAQVYRCGNEYTNNAAAAKAKGCKVMDGGNVTIIQGTRVQQPGAAAGTAGVAMARPVSPPVVGGSSMGQRVDSAEQRARDTDSRAILEAELRRAESRQGELLREYNNGEPEKQGSEARNYQKYLDRVADLKASITRNESDIAGIRREIARLGAPAAAR